MKGQGFTKYLTKQGQSFLAKPLHRHTPLYRHTVTPSYRYTPLHRYTATPSYRYTAPPLHRYTVIPLNTVKTSPPTPTNNSLRLVEKARLESTYRHLPIDHKAQYTGCRYDTDMPNHWWNIFGQTNYSL